MLLRFWCAPDWRAQSCARHAPTCLVQPPVRFHACSGIFSGLAYDALERHKRFGPRVVLALGCLLNAAGYLGLWAALQG